MSARIVVDLANVHPVFDNRWHRVQLDHFPEPGETIVTYCGVAETVEFVAGATDYVRTCWSCDLIHRRQHGIRVLPDHPGLAGEAPPRRH
jgi:hypothetical protein